MAHFDGDGKSRRKRCDDFRGEGEFGICGCGGMVGVLCLDVLDVEMGLW